MLAPHFVDGKTKALSGLGGCRTYAQWNTTRLEKECIWVCSNEVDEPRAHYTEWNKSERERQILYINTYICKEIQLVHSKGDQSWVFSGRTDAKAKTPILRPPHVKSRLIGKHSDAGRDWGAGGEGDDRGLDG